MGPAPGSLRRVRRRPSSLSRGSTTSGVAGLRNGPQHAHVFKVFDPSSGANLIGETVGQGSVEELHRDRFLMVKATDGMLKSGRTTSSCCPEPAASSRTERCESRPERQIGRSPASPPAKAASIPTPSMKRTVLIDARISRGSARVVSRPCGAPDSSTDQAMVPKVVSH